MTWPRPNSLGLFAAAVKQSRSGTHHPSVDARAMHRNKKMSKGKVKPTSLP
jgi:hypothetical protein